MTDPAAPTTPRTDESLAEYVRHHQCWQADPNVTIADWHRGILAIEAEARAGAASTEATPPTDEWESHHRECDRLGCCCACRGDARTGAVLRFLHSAPTRRMFARALGGGEHPNDEYLSMATAILDKVATEVEDKPWLT